jgi:hypothetical protein
MFTMFDSFVYSKEKRRYGKMVRFIRRTGFSLVVL